MPHRDCYRALTILYGVLRFMQNAKKYLVIAAVVLAVMYATNKVPALKKLTGAA